MAEQMVALATQQPGFLGVESARKAWVSPFHIGKAWKLFDTGKHTQIICWRKKMGREKWYAAYKTRICKVERDYGMEV